MAYRLVLPFADVGDGITPADGAKLFVYEPGTVTEKTSYSDFALTTPNSNPVVADSDGVFGAIFLDTQADIKLTDKNDVEIWGPERVYPPSDSVGAFDIATEFNSLAQTADEVTAGVTPTDYSYPPGNVLRYGADNTGVTDASTAMQNAIDSSLEVIVPEGTYLVRVALVLRSGTQLRGVGNPTIKTDGVNQLINATGSVGTVSAVTADVNQGATTIAVAAGTGSTYTDGFYIRSERINQTVDAADHKFGEIGIVDSVSTDTVTIDGMIMGVRDYVNDVDTYAVADTASAAPVTFVSNVSVNGIRFTNDTYTSGPTTATSGLLDFELVRDFAVSDCIFEENNQGAMYFFSCLNGSVTGNQVARLRDDTGILGYGVEAGYNSANISITGNSFRECRHAFTTGTGTASGLTPGYGIQRGITFSGNTVTACTSIGIDTHEDSDGVTISGNTVTGCVPAGIQNRSYRTTITGNTVTSCKGKGIRIASSALDTVVSGNTIANIGLNSVDGYGIEVESISVIVTGNSISSCYSDGIRVGAGAARNITITGNECKNNGEGGTGDGIKISRGGAISRLTITGNVCTDDRATKTQRYGLRIDSGTTVSPLTCLIAGNNFTSNLTGSYNNNGTGTVLFDNNVGDSGQAPLTFTAADTTPSVAGENFFLTDTGALTIGDLDDGVPGQEITILSKGAITFDTTATNLNGSSVDIVTAAGDITTWVCEDGTNWYLKGYVDTSVDNSAGA